MTSSALAALAACEFHIVSPGETAPFYDLA